jgi:hypothetical protein
LVFRNGAREKTPRPNRPGFFGEPTSPGDLKTHWGKGLAETKLRSNLSPGKLFGEMRFFWPKSKSRNLPLFRIRPKVKGGKKAAPGWGGDILE